MKSETSPPSRFVPIKLVLNDQIFVQAEFSLNWSGTFVSNLNIYTNIYFSVGSMVEFIEAVIFESHEDIIELCIL